MNFAEFLCKCGKCGLHQPHEELIVIYDDLERYFGRPPRISSGYRCAEHNRVIGGSSRSYHTHGMAMDVYIPEIPSGEIYDYLDRKYPDSCGIGRYKSHTHVDCRTYRARWSMI